MISRVIILRHADAERGRGVLSAQADGEETRTSGCGDLVQR